MQHLWYDRKPLIKILSYYGAVQKGRVYYDIGNYNYGLVLNAIAPDFEEHYGQPLGIEKKGDVIESFLGYKYLALRYGVYNENKESTKSGLAALSKLEELCDLVFELSVTCESNVQLRSILYRYIEDRVIIEVD